MPEEQTHTLPLKAAYAFGAEKGLGREIDDIKDMVIEWDRPYTSSLKRGFIVALFEKHGLFDEFKARYWAVRNTPEGQRLRRRFLRIKDQYDEWLRGGADAIADEEDEVGICRRDRSARFFSQELNPHRSRLALVPNR
jgi:hypothetical protein